MVTLCHHPTHQTYLQTLLFRLSNLLLPPSCHGVAVCFCANVSILPAWLGLSSSHSSCEVICVCVCVCGRVGGCVPYLRVEWRWQISELRDVCLKRSQIAFVPIRAIAALQTVPPLRLRYRQIAVTRRRCSTQRELRQILVYRANKKRGPTYHA